jgi:hypothetical protein
MPASVPPPGASGSASDPEPPPPLRYAKTDYAALFAAGLQEDLPSILERQDGNFLFYPGTVNSIIGESESGKTWLALLAVKQELDKGNSVIFLDFEDSAARVAKRLLAMEVKQAAIIERFIYISPDGRFTRTDEAELLSYGVQECAVVVLDGVTEALAAHGLNGHKEEDVAEFYEWLPKWLARQGPAVVLIDHVPKTNASQVKGAIGSQHKRAAITGASYIVEPRKPMGKGLHGTSDLYVGKDKLGSIDHQRKGDDMRRWAGTLHVDSNSTMGYFIEAYIEMPAPVVTAGVPVPMSPAIRNKFDRANAIVAFVKRHNAGVNMSEIKADVKGEGKVVGDTAWLLEQAGFLKNIGTEKRPLFIYEMDFDGDISKL